MFPQQLCRATQEVSATSIEINAFRFLKLSIFSRAYNFLAGGVCSSSCIRLPAVPCCWRGGTGVQRLQSILARMRGALAICMSALTNVCHLQGWSTATAGLAADQLVALLRDAVGRRNACYAASDQQRDAASTAISDWEAAICDVHAEYFEEYQRWMRKMCLPVRA